MTTSPDTTVPTSTCSSSGRASPASTSSTGPGRPGSRSALVEAGGGVGGTWFWNRYPGARFDSESYTYGYLFSRELFDEWEWQEHFAPQPETERYLNHVVDRFDLRRHIRFDAKVTRRRVRRGVGDVGRRAPSDGRAPESGESGTPGAVPDRRTGVLSVPYLPDVPGRDDFRGEAHHTGLWPAEPVDFVGKRVAVDRHLVERRAGRPDDPRRRRVAHRLPAHGQLVHAAQQHAHHPRGAGAAAGRLRGRCARR